MCLQDALLLKLWACELPLAPFLYFALMNGSNKMSTHLVHSSKNGTLGHENVRQLQGAPLI